ncbi:Putative zinc-finger [Paenibacillaceae bacterium GAS479]|nr:Putative zinc-finger [Paenibacillaceae bacterium GAS479]
MTCQEVVDYMNRYLDGDLDEHERLLLMEHLNECPDDQELFERLKRLSSDLEELPKIVPPFSLVDSILPQLAEIDDLRDAKAASRGGASLSLNESEEAASEEESEMPARSVRRSDTSRFSKRARIWTGSAAAAAAAVVILLAVPWGSTSLDKQLAMDGGSNTSQAGMFNEKAVEEENGASTADNMQKRTMNTPESAADPLQQGDTVPTATDPDRSLLDDSAKGQDEIKNNMIGPSVPSVPSGGGKGSTTYPSPGSGSFNKYAPGGSSAIPGFTSPSPDGVANQKGGLMAVPEVTYSPDGQYSYSISQGWVVIQKEDGGKQFDHTFEGAITEPAWSGDSRYLTVAVQAKAGQVLTYKIDVENGSFEKTEG